MNLTLPDSLKTFVDQQVNSGRYSDANAFVADLVRTEAAIFERAEQGEAIAADEHFDRRLAVLLDEAESGGDYVDVTAEDFDAMEREATELVRKRSAS